MAKAKKSEAKESSPAKKAPAHKPQAKKPAAAFGNPMVDTSLAAQNAARFLTARIGNKAAASGGGSPGEKTPAKQESSGFKNLKQNLVNPHLSGLDSVLDKSAPASKSSGLPHTGGKQVGHNQTFGADVNRVNVPRRTAG